jgi:hypothetical protein
MTTTNLLTDTTMVVVQLANRRTKVTQEEEKNSLTLHRLASLLSPFTVRSTKLSLSVCCLSLCALSFYSTQY